MEYFYDLIFNLIFPFLENKEPYEYLVTIWCFSLLTGFCFGFLLAFIKRVFILSSR